MSSPPAFRVQLGPQVVELICECCGELKQRVWGFISRDGEARAVYHALLNTMEPNPRVGLSLSVGAWWEGSAPDLRSWVHIEMRAAGDNVEMALRDPKESNQYPWESGGRPMEREQALASPGISEFWDIADYIAAADPTVHCYLHAHAFDAAGREVRKIGRA